MGQELTASAEDTTFVKKNVWGGLVLGFGVDFEVWILSSGSDLRFVIWVFGFGFRNLGFETRILGFSVLGSGI